MSDNNRPGPHTPPATVPDMVDDFRRRRETLQTQARELAQLHQEVLRAAEREGSGIVAAARGKIAAILTEARRDLMNLAKRVDSVAGEAGDVGLAAGPPTDRSGAADASSTILDAAAVHESLQRARREIGQLMRAAEPDIDALTRERPAPPVPAQRVEEPGRPMPVAPERQAAWIPRTFEPPPRRWAVRPSWAISFAIAALAIVAAIWWMQRSSSRSGSGGPRVESPPSPRAAAPPAAAPPPATVVQPPRPLTLVLEARRPVWVRTTIDGRAAEGRLIQTGERSRIAADREVSIRAGDAGALSVSVNGGAPQALGRDGEVVVRRFTPAVTPPSSQSPARAQASPSPPAPPVSTSGEVSARNTQPSGAPAREGAPSAGVPSAGVPSAGVPSNVSAELTTTAQRWLDAYARQDAAGMQAVSLRDTKVNDQRSAAERLPASAEAVRRTLEGVSFQLVGETAILTARMIEQGNVGGRPAQYISMISLMWIRERDQWRLMDVQMLSESKLRVRH